MSKTENGKIGGNGLIDEWKSAVEQKNKDGYVSNAYVSSIDLNTPYEWQRGVDTIVSYDGTESYSVSYMLNSFYEQPLTSDWGLWLNSQGIEFTLFEGSSRFSLPFDNYFIGVDSEYPTAITLYDNYKWNNYKDGLNVSYDYSGQTFAFDSGVLKYFTWLNVKQGDDNYYGWLQFAIDNDRYVSGHMILTNVTSIKSLLGDKKDIKKPQLDPTKGIPSSAVGGAGDLVKKNLGEIPTPSIPTMGVSTTGALNVYKLEQGDLANFMSEIFHVDKEDVENQDITYYIAKYVNNSIDDFINGDLTKFVIDTHILPVTPTTQASKSNIHIGGKTCQYSQAYKVNSDYVDVNYGTITINGDTVSFYDGASDLVGARYKLYLPFGIGYVDLDPSLVWCHTLQVTIRFNIIDGSCIAFVKSSVLDGGAVSVIGQYTGSCCVHLPMTGENYARLVGGMMNVGNAIKSADVYGTVETATSIARPNITMSNSYNASSSFMSVRYPYLLIEKPTENLSDNFYERNGGLINTRYILDDLRGSGFTKCSNVDIMSLGSIKTSEKVEIKRLLEQGVYL